MRLDTTILTLAMAAVVAGCGAVVTQANPAADGGFADASPTTDDPPAIDRPPGVEPTTCTSTADCPGFLECRGDPGCGVPWTCQPRVGRFCAPDFVAYCGCDHQDFYGSSTCPPRPHAWRGSCAAGEPGVDAGPSERVCRANVDCRAGEQCLGAEGCGTPWTCQTVGGCTRDLVPFCGCDGTTFMNSSTCPGRPYARRGPCGIVPPPVDAGPIDGGDEPPPLCPADDARGVGNCAAFFGYRWDGARCVGVGGCSCAGSGCASLAWSIELCDYNHRTCPRPR